MEPRRLTVQYSVVVQHHSRHCGGTAASNYKCRKVSQRSAVSVVSDAFKVWLKCDVDFCCKFYGEHDSERI